MENRYAYALSLLNLRPKSWNTQGWIKFRDTYNLPKEIISFDDENESQPTSAKEFDALAHSYLEEVTKPLNAAVCAINADDYVTLSAEKKDKTFRAWIATCEGLYPTCLR